MIRSLSDIDALADLERLRDELQSLPHDVAPQTRKWFDETSWSASSFQR
jgi:hypothetical protein